MQIYLGPEQVQKKKKSKKINLDCFLLKNITFFVPLILLFILKKAFHEKLR